MVYNCSKNNGAAPIISNEAAAIVSEFINRKRLAKLGIVSNCKDISFLKAECLIHVSSEFDRLENEEMKRKSRK